MKKNRVIGSILENLDFIEIIFKKTYPQFSSDKGNTGDSKEYTVQDFISSYLTNEYRIRKGQIFGQNGHSNNIDCVILAPNHPNLTTPKRSIILAEGVYAAIEIKPDISDKKEFMRGLQQIKSIKKIERKTYLPDFTKLLKKEPNPDFVKKIPSIIFASKSLTPDNTISFIKNKLTIGELTIYDLPDIIVTLDHGLYVCSPDIRQTIFGKYFMSENPNFEVNSILHFFEATKAETLAIFILHLLNLPSPTLIVHDFILNDYLKGFSGVKIRGFEMGHFTSNVKLSNVKK